MIPMFDVLLEAGFTPDPQVISDNPGGLTLDLGRGFVIHAVHCLSDRTFKREVLLSGVYSDARTVHEMETWLPEFVESREAGLAHLAYAFDQEMGERFVPATPQWWIDIGRSHRMLVPVVRRLAEYQARPRCSVDPRWMRLLVQELRERLPFLDDPEHVTFSFDGSTLFVRLGEWSMPAPAVGTPWQVQYRLTVSVLRQNLPARRRPRSDWLELNDGQLFLGSHRLGHAEVETVRKAWYE